MDHITFIMKVESGELSNDEFFQHAQEFVDSGIWKNLQGSWQRAVHSWEEMGYVTL